MAPKIDESLPDLGDLEREVMQLVWANGTVTAEVVREQLSRPLRTTVRTVLRRLEEKGYVDPRRGRPYLCLPRGRSARPALPPRPCSASSTGSATVRSRRSSSAWWTTRCSTSSKLRALADQVAKAKAEARGGGKNDRQLLAEAALRSLRVLGGVVFGQSTSCLRVRNPHVHMTAWAVVVLRTAGDAAR